ncbi:MAG TPA: glycosyltransferase family 39 protein, partial [Candidatus Kapabacteria bacterium]
MTREKKILGGIGITLAGATFLTRFPLRSHTLFEFDSINFAVALKRFDLGQVTPQVPGYILHVLLARFLFLFTKDQNLAYIWLSIILSIGSVLIFWRAAAALRGERVGIVAALLWLTTPLFWLHGAINAIYIEEAFYTSAILYCGIKWIRNEKLTWEVILYGVSLSLATGARQTSILFFLPATIVLILRRRPSKSIMIWSIVAFVLVTSAWVFELLRESGGLSNYLYWAKAESNFKT